MLQRRLQLFDVAHLRETRTIAHQPGEFRKLPRCSYGVYFHAAVIQVPGPATHAQLMRGVPDEGAKTDTLYAPIDFVFARGLTWIFGFQGRVSG